MTQDHATPVPRRIFAVASPGTAVPDPGPATVPLALAPGTADVASTGSGAGPVLADAVPMTAMERARHALTRWAGTAARGVRELWLDPGRFLHAIWHPAPESMAEHRAYIRSQAWVPGGLAGKSAAVIKWAGIVYHILIGHPVKAAMKAVTKTAGNIDKAAERPLRLLVLAGFCFLLYIIL